MKPPLFHVGQAVVSLYAVHPGFHLEAGITLPKKDKVYHVRGYVPGVSELYSIHLVEIINPTEHEDGFPFETALPESYFAPVEEMPTEMLAELLEALEPVTA